MFLETEQLILRKFRDSDFEDYCADSLGANSKNTP